MNSDIRFIGKVDWRNSNKRFGIRQKDRLGHMYVIGKTGVGKSTFLVNMAISDIVYRNGFAFLDPHGDVITDLLSEVPDFRKEDVIYLNAAEESAKCAYNPIWRIKPGDQHLVASGLISVFKKVWRESWGPRMEHILRMTLLSLLELENASLLDISRLLTEPKFRVNAYSRIHSQHLLSFWLNEFEKYSPMMKAEVVSPILNKVSILSTSEPLRRILGSSGRDIRIGEIMNKKKILLLNLSKGELGEDVSNILGCLFLTAFQLAALNRSKVVAQKRIPYFVYVDEMQSFVTESFADILSEARKYGLGLVMAHQYIGQLTDELRKAIFGNVGTMIAFRVGAEDAKYLAPEFAPIFREDDLVRLGKYSFYIKLMIDGVTSKPFSATSIET